MTLWCPRRQAAKVQRRNVCRETRWRGWALHGPEAAVLGLGSTRLTLHTLGAADLQEDSSMWWAGPTTAYVYLYRMLDALGIHSQIQRYVLQWLVTPECTYGLSLLPPAELIC
jgi:hypothetical protein